MVVHGSKTIVCIDCKERVYIIQIDSEMNLSVSEPIFYITVTPKYHNAQYGMHTWVFEVSRAGQIRYTLS